MSKDLKDLKTLTGRNMAIYFRDKQSFFLSFITPMILIVLFVTFLKSVYEDTLLSLMPEGLSLDANLIDAFSASWLVSSILGVSCVTIAFCANTIMVTDKVNSNIIDLQVAPVKNVVVSLSYFFANYLSTLIVCLACLVVGIGYVSSKGFYMNGHDIIMIIGTMLLCIAFGTLLAAIVETFISSQGGASAVATLVSSMYGFLCGAYMPISQFNEGIRNFVSFIPGTHGTVLFRYYFMRGTIKEMSKTIPKEVVDAISKGFDNQLFFFDTELSNGQLITVLGLSCLVLLAIYIVIVGIKTRTKK